MSSGRFVEGCVQVPMHPSSGLFAHQQPSWLPIAAAAAASMLLESNSVAAAQLKNLLLFPSSWFCLPSTILCDSTLHLPAYFYVAACMSEIFRNYIPYPNNLLANPQCFVFFHVFFQRWFCRCCRL